MVLKKKTNSKQNFVLQEILQSLEIKMLQLSVKGPPVINDSFPCVTLNELAQQMDLEEKREERCLTSLKPLIFNSLKFNDELLIMNAARKMGELQYNGLEISS